MKVGTERCIRVQRSGRRERIRSQCLQNIVTGVSVPFLTKVHRRPVKHKRRNHGRTDKKKYARRSNERTYSIRNE